MEKSSFRRSTDNPNAPILSASTQLLKDVTVAALRQRNKQCTPTTSCSDVSFSSASVADSIQDDMSDRCSLTQAGLEEYDIRASSYYDQPVLFHHQKQSSYAQSEGYHSYVSSSDSSSATPFLDRLRQESEMLSRQSSHHWSQNDLSLISSVSTAPSPTPTTSLMVSSTSMANGNRTDDITTDNDGTQYQQKQQQQLQQQPHQTTQTLAGNKTNNNSNSNTNTNSNNSNNSNNNATNSSESTSSTETLKWHGSTSDVSEASQATGFSAVSESASNSQLIVHSSRVLTPKRHHSESILYLSNEQPQLSPNRSLSKENTKSENFTAQQKESFGFGGSQQTAARTNVNHRHSPSYPPVHTTLTLQPYNQQHHQPQLLHKSEQQQHEQQKKQTKLLLEEQTSACSLPKSSLIVNKLTTTKIITTTAAAAAPDTTTTTSPTVSVTRNADASPTTLRSEITRMPQQHDSQKSSISLVTISSSSETSGASEDDVRNVATNAVTSNDESIDNISPNSATTHRSNHRLFPVSTYTEHSNTSQFVQHPKPQFSAGLQKSSIQASNKEQTAQSQSNDWHTVAELINDFERSTEQQQQHQQPEKYAFMDPNKTQRISNPALKAFQKNAVQSYFERQQQHQQHFSQKRNFEPKQPQKSPPFLTQAQQQQQQILRPHSFQALSTKKEISFSESQRSSLPNTYNINNANVNHHQQPQSHQQLKTTILNSTNRMTVSNSYTQLNTTATTPEYDLGQMRSFSRTTSPEPPPPPPRSRSLMPVSLLRRSSSASDHADFRDQYSCTTQAQSVKNISNAEKSLFNDCGMPPPPPPPPRGARDLERRTSSASEYAAMREKFLLQQAAAHAHQQNHPQLYNRQHSTQRSINYRTSVNAAKDNWVPERPPKNPNLRIPSPDLPPPPTDIDGHLSDEPLPPPPPEILQRQPYYEVSALSNSTAATSKLNGVELASSNRRNSFAEKSTRKIYYSHSNSHDMQTTAKIPPLIPKKPTNLETNHAARSIMLPAPPYKVALDNKTQPQQPTLNQNRKRPHNPGVAINVTTQSDGTANANRSNATSLSPQTLTPVKPAPPLPLKPRAPKTADVQMRCNSKASYLPRQSLEKLNNTDPDHGSYKLTLTSNEALVNSSASGQCDIIAADKGKLANNLPDVLPLGAKLQQQPHTHPHPQTASPIVCEKRTPLQFLSFGSNSNMTTTAAYPLQHRYSTPVMGTTNSNAYSSNHSHNNSNVNGNMPHAMLHYARSQSYDAHNETATKNNTARFMSQSTIDLKCHKAQTLDTTYEDDQPCSLLDNSKIPLSPAQSENNINIKIRPNIKHQLNPTTDNLSKSSEPHAATTDGQIVRAELVSTILPPMSPAFGSNKNLNKTIIRKDSLRENIEKITQLQCKLMSAQIADNALSLSSYGSKPLALSNTSIAEINEHSDTTAVETKHEDHEGQKSLPPVTNCTEGIAIANHTLTLPLADSTTPPAMEISETSPVISSTLTTELNNDENSLKFMQRSEIVLRVNPSMVEASSQTDDLNEDDTAMLRLALPQQFAKENRPTRTTTLQPRQCHPIEFECENMCKELAALLPNNDKLSEIILPQSTKTAADYVNNLYNPHVPLRLPAKHDVGTSTLMRMKFKGRSENKNYPTIGLPKAELELTTLTNDETNDDCDILKRKVKDLIAHLKQKIGILGNEQLTVEEETAINDVHGSNLLSKISEIVRPIEATKFRTYVDDVGHITSLLLSLSERLARAENCLYAMHENRVDKKSLETKRDRLLEQLDEARRLKNDIDRRGKGLSNMIERNLNADDVADFDYFINMKAKLIADSRDISNQIKTSQELLNALSETLVTSDC